MIDEQLKEQIAKKKNAAGYSHTEVLSQEEIDALLTPINTLLTPINTDGGSLNQVFTFDDVRTVTDDVIRRIVRRVTEDELTKALIREDEEIRKRFYSNMSLDALKTLSTKLQTLESFAVQEKRAAQQKILRIIAETPVYRDTRFESGFENVEAFESYLLDTRTTSEPSYGIFDKNVTMLRFFDADNGERVLQDIKLKNEAEGMGTVKIPNTKIELINYSICPKCGHIFSFKDLSAYYAHPRPDPQFKKQARQFREDTRMFCAECETYFLPALVISDGTPKNEVQFLCRVQTMNAIETFYTEKKIPVLSRKGTNLIREIPASGNGGFKCDVRGTARFRERERQDNKKCHGIKNDVLLKEMESRPGLISNLLQYTPANLVINLIDGINVRNGDLLFGEWTA